jgi:hypothetical protein
MDMPSIASAAAESKTGTGCFYRGPTRIILQADGKMRVWSKQTSPADVRSGCGDAGGLASDEGALVDVPADQLVFVGEAPGAGHTQVPAGGIGGPSNTDRLPLGTYSKTTTLRHSAKYTAERTMMRPEKFADMANLYVEGELSGRLTLASQGTIVVTGDLLTADDSKDLMGLTASTSEIYNPVLEEVKASCPTSAVSSCMWAVPANPVHQGGRLKDYDARPKVLSIEAALYASAASLRLQNWKDGGPLGTLELKGSIAQMFRGVLAWEDESGTLLSGLKKSYTYNERLREGRPLLFAPIENGTSVIRWLEKIDPPASVKG